MCLRTRRNDHFTSGPVQYFGYCRKVVVDGSICPADRAIRPEIYSNDNNIVARMTFKPFGVNRTRSEEIDQHAGEYTWKQHSGSRTGSTLGLRVNSDS